MFKQSNYVRLLGGASVLALVALRFPDGVMVPNNVMVPQQCRT